MERQIYEDTNQIDGSYGAIDEDRLLAPKGIRGYLWVIGLLIRV